MSKFNPVSITKLENILSSKKIEELKNNFIKEYPYEQDPPCDIDKDKGIIFNFDSQIGEVIAVYTFEKYLSNILKEVTNELKYEIEQSNIFLNQEEQINFFNSLLKSFEHAEKKNKETFEKFKVCYKPQETIRLYLKEKYNFTIPYKSDIELIHSIFDYMKGKNEKRELILNEDDFNLLIEYTEYLVKEEEVPTIKNKISPKLTQGEISFTYWVLHQKWYNSYRAPKTRELYSTFLKALFEQFNNTTEKSIKGQFGNKDRCYPHNFLPKIITKYLEKEDKK